MLDPSLVIVAAAAALPAGQKFDVVSEGPLGAGAGYRCTAGWRDARGFHRIYAFGYESEERAREAAAEGAKDFGYVTPQWWEVWKARLSFHP